MPTRTITTEYVQLLGLAARLRRRLNYSLRILPETAIPDSEWRETFAAYTNAAKVLASREQQRRSLDARHPLPPMTDEEYAAELLSLQEETVLTMDAGKLETALAMRKAKNGARLDDDTGSS